MRSPHLDRRSVLGRTIRAAVTALPVVLAVAAAATGGTVAVLRTEWGSERARRLVLPRLNAQIAGDLAVA